MALIKAKRIDNLEMYCLEDELIGNAIIKEGMWEPVIHHFLIFLLKNMQNPICLDVGANIGTYSLSMAPHCKEILAFEPTQENFKLLEQNASLNKLTNIQPCNFGLSNLQKEIEIYLPEDQEGDPKNFGTYRIELNTEEKKQKSEKILVRPGDDVVLEKKLEKLDFIKIDVEGHETQCLLGLKDSIKKFQPVITIEWNDDLTREGFKKNDLWNTVLEGYEAGWIQCEHERIKKTLSRIPALRPLRGITRSAYKLIFGEYNRYYKEFDPKKSYPQLILTPKNHPMRKKIQSYRAQML